MTSLNVFRCDYASLYEVVSVGPSVRPYVPCYFRMTNMAVFEGKKSSNDIITNDTMNDDGVVASYEWCTHAVLVLFYLVLKARGTHVWYTLATHRPSNDKHTHYKWLFAAFLETLLDENFPIFYGRSYMKLSVTLERMCGNYEIIESKGSRLAPAFLCQISMKIIVFIYADWWFSPRIGLYIVHV